MSQFVDDLKQCARKIRGRPTIEQLQECMRSKKWYVPGMLHSTFRAYIREAGIKVRPVKINRRLR